MQPVPEESLSIILKALEDNKALEILCFRVFKSCLPDYMIIASGTSSRHVAALAEHVEKALKKEGMRPDFRDGFDQANWVILETGPACIHIFRPEVRAYYDLESLYNQPTPTYITH